MTTSHYARLVPMLGLAAVLALTGCTAPPEDPMNNVTQAEVEAERNTLLTAMKETIPIAWEPTGDRGYYNCGGPKGISGLSHTQQTFGPPVEDREASARTAYELIKEHGYPVELVHRDNENPPAWVVQSKDGDWYFAIDFRDTGTVITDATRCFPWDDDVDGPPLEHSPGPDGLNTVVPRPAPSGG
jgi:hypothetical protein